MICEEVQITRTVLDGADVAVARSRGSRSCVNKKGPRQLVPMWASWPWAVTLPWGVLSDAGVVPENV